jgi:histidinol-phosphatase
VTASNETLLQAVADVARVAGDVALRHFKTGIAVETKADGSPVTIADRAAEEVARAWITRHFPHDDVLGEEYGLTSSGGARRWFIDPIDGTKSFVHGVPLWGTLVAVAEGPEVLAGAINCAAAGEIVSAALGYGCWHNGMRCHVSDVSAVESATILSTGFRFVRDPARRQRWQAIVDRAAIARTWGDCYGYVLVATGRAELMIDDRMSPWDAAALMPVIREAGGVFTDWDGRLTLDGRDSLATNAALSATFRSALGVPVLDVVPLP